MPLEFNLRAKPPQKPLSFQIDIGKEYLTLDGRTVVITGLLFNKLGIGFFSGVLENYAPIVYWTLFGKYAQWGKMPVDDVIGVEAHPCNLVQEKKKAAPKADHQNESLESLWAHYHNGGMIQYQDFINDVWHSYPQAWVNDQLTFSNHYNSFKMRKAQ